MLSAIGNNNVGRKSDSLMRVVLMVWGLSLVGGWGWSLAWWVQWVVLGEGRVLLLFTWWCFVYEGYRLPSKWAHFLS